MDLETFNAASCPEANAVLLSCCASRRFAAAVEAGRPYPSVAAAEQSGVTDSDRAALAAANAEYEARFGHVFLICASGLTGGQMLAELRARLTNTPDTERIVATRELARITALRLRKALS